MRGRMMVLSVKNQQLRRIFILSPTLFRKGRAHITIDLVATGSTTRLISRSTSGPSKDPQGKHVSVGTISAQKTTDMKHERKKTRRFRTEGGMCRFFQFRSSG
mmetsp:Transcript_9691/g.26989  ORF Transcript_9691/g.26989 Transcript_9691/m.26989 type:complete len:103 (-) Transcript_9691:227-535(-)